VGRLCYASDYFGQLYEWALKLIKAGKAYVDDLTADEIRQHRGTLTEPGQGQSLPQPHGRRKSRPVCAHEEGEFPDGSRVLRAKIDMASPNLNMRDPVMYRILHATHHRTGDEWCIYPDVRLRARPVGFD
jgi:glutaminyl-tRNA synthetase